MPRADGRAILPADMLLYLATPYSKYPQGLGAAHDAAAEAVALLLGAGLDVISPVCACHHVARLSGMDPKIGNPVWMRLNRKLMERCDALVVVMMDGWDKSLGVSLEIQFFEAARKPVKYMLPGSVPDWALT